jgi:ubiquitin C-terminal hydrolase
MDPSSQPDLSKKGQVGLANLGNTCYLNSVLQVLRHIPDLTMFFNRHSDGWIHSGDSKEASLTRAYKDLIETQWAASPPGFVRPAGFYHFFKKALEGTAVDHMMTPLPHDAHEALVFVMDQLHEGMKKPLSLNVVAESGTAVHAALTAWKEQVAPNYSPIVDYFFGLMEVGVQCSGCQKISRRFEPFNMLKAGFPEHKAATLVECLNYEFQDEAIDEYSCDHCKPKRHPAAIRRRIWRLPNNLIVVAKRFNPNGTKCHAALSTEPSMTFAPWFSEASPEGSKTASYTLQSIIDHHGSANGGHYTAQVRSPVTGVWNLYDDESVRDLGDGSKPFQGATNYILTFRRV